MAFVVLMGVTVALGIIAMVWMEYEDHKYNHSTE